MFTQKRESPAQQKNQKDAAVRGEGCEHAHAPAGKIRSLETHWVVRSTWYYIRLVLNFSTSTIEYVPILLILISVLN